MILDILTPLICQRFLNEERYRQGHIRIINALPGRRILGLHVPEMKAVAKQIAHRSDAIDVIRRFEKEHEKDRFSLCYEETVVWGLAINAMKCSIGDRMEMGGLLGSAPVQDVHPCSSAEFIHRGGRIPAPMQSLKN